MAKPLPIAKQFDFDDRLMFGKYLGKTVSQIITEEPTYILWALDNVAHFAVTEQVLEEACNAA